MEQHSLCRGVLYIPCYDSVAIAVGPLVVSAKNCAQNSGNELAVAQFSKAANSVSSLKCSINNSSTF